MKLVLKLFFSFIVVMLLVNSLLAIDYKVSYLCTATPVLGVKESTSTIEFYYAFVDEALASPTQVGTAVIVINKRPTYDKGPIQLLMYMDNQYFDLYAEHLGDFWEWSIDWIGSVKDPRYRLKGDRYDLGGFTEAGVFDYWRNRKRGNEQVITILTTDGLFKKIFDLTKPFKVVFDIEYSLDHLNIKMTVIPKTHIEVSYIPRK